MNLKLINCTVCHRKFPINTKKHPYRKIIYCPFCRTSYENKWYDSKWKPNKKWRKNRTKSKPFTIADMRRLLGKTERGLMRAFATIKKPKLENLKLPEKKEKKEDASKSA